MERKGNKKRCYKCKKTLGILNFYKDSSRKGGFSNRCKKCDDIKTYKRTKIRKPSKSPNRRFNIYKRGAKSGSRNYEFNLTEKEFMSFWGKNCDYCGDKIDGVGIDRVDNNLGYDLENCVSCCPICNRMKMAQTFDDFINRCEKIVYNYLHPHSN